MCFQTTLDMQSSLNSIICMVSGLGFLFSRLFTSLSINGLQLIAGVLYILLFYIVAIDIVYLHANRNMCGSRNILTHM